MTLLVGQKLVLLSFDYDNWSEMESQINIKLINIRLFTNHMVKQANNRNKDEKKQNQTFGIDCSRPVEDKVFNTSNFAEFLRQRIKVKGNNDERKVSVESNIGLSKRYLKYLTKKYLKKHSLREFLYVIASDKKNYQIKYFNIQQEGADEE
jgi:large subunit ribosomal protein L22e